MYKTYKLPNLLVLVLLVLFPLTSNGYVYNQLDFQESHKPKLLAYTYEDLEKASCDWKLISQAAELLMLHEGFSANPYKDSNGNWTQGYGRQVGKKKLYRVSEAKAREWLYEDIRKVIQDLDTNIHWWRNCSPVRQQVLINFAYNVGIGGLYKFSRFLRATETRQYTKASKELLYSGSNKTKYWRQVGYRAEQLALAMKTGKWDMEAIKAYYS